MFVLINSSSIFPIDKSIVENEPMRVFNDFYIQMNLDVSTPFSTWLNTFLVPLYNTGEYSTEQLTENISAILNDKMLLRQALLRLYPVQYDFNEQNWPYIQIEMERVIRNKRARKVTMVAYPVLEKILENGINRVLSV